MTIPKELLYILVFLGVKNSTLNYWVRLIPIITVYIPVAGILALGLLFTWIILGDKKLVSIAGNRQKILGEPLLFPVTLTHNRVSPVKNKFTHRLLLVGIPIGLRGRVGPLLSIDPEGPTSNHVTSLSKFLTWFSFDPVRYLQRGNDEHGFRDKLDHFLRSMNKDPKDWPYAYLLSVPRFLWWERNVVSFWYLYSQSQQLDAMIMEINNSFDEKRNIFFHLYAGSDQRCGKEKNPPEPKYLDQEQSVLSLPSLSDAVFYKGHWDKHIFASPFEKVEGSISNRFLDPLQESSWSPSVSLSNVVSIGLAGGPKMMTRISCRTKPVNPVKMNSILLARFIFQWTWPGTLTTPRIIFQALKIQYYQRLMKMASKPTIKSGSIARHITPLERSLEPFWRAFLSHSVKVFPGPIEVTYIPSKSFWNDPVYLSSPDNALRQTEGARKLTLEVLDPAFYMKAVNCTYLGDACLSRNEEGDLSSPTASPLIATSDDKLLQDLLGSYCGTRGTTPNVLGFGLGSILEHCRGAGTQMDSFVLSVMPPSMHLRYTSCVIRYALAHRFALGSQAILWAYGLLVRWVILNMAWSICWRLNDNWSS